MFISLITIKFAYIKIEITTLLILLNQSEHRPRRLIHDLCQAYIDDHLPESKLSVPSFYYLL